MFVGFSVFELGFGLSKLFFFCFVELIFGLDKGQLVLIFFLLLAFFLQFLNQGVKIIHLVTTLTGRIVRLGYFEGIAFHCIMSSGLFEFLFCRPELVDFFILLRCIQLVSFGLLLEDNFLLVSFDVRQLHIFEIFVLEESRIKQRSTKWLSVSFSKSILALTQLNQLPPLRLEE